MLKIQLMMIIILFCTSIFSSCEYASDVMRPGVPDTDAGVADTDDTDTMKTPGMTDPGNMEDEMDMFYGSAVVINELMADNDNVIMDPQGDHDDWVELFNRTDSPVDLTGMYLSDKEDNPTKWQFPDGTIIAANGYLIIWCDEDHDDPETTEGLHSNFKLSKSGEAVLLVDTDANGNTVLDSIVFDGQETDVAIGRIPNSTGDFQVVAATPGAENLAQ